MKPGLPLSISLLFSASPTRTWSRFPSFYLGLGCSFLPPLGDIFLPLGCSFLSLSITTSNTLATVSILEGVPSFHLLRRCFLQVLLRSSLLLLRRAFFLLGHAFLPLQRFLRIPRSAAYSLKFKYHVAGTGTAAEGNSDWVSTLGVVEESCTSSSRDVDPLMLYSKNLK
jgi:hypothetical protein